MAHLYYILPHFVIFVAYMSDNIQGHFFAGQPLFRTLMKKLKKKKRSPTIVQNMSLVVLKCGRQLANRAVRQMQKHRST